MSSSSISISTLSISRPPTVELEEWEIEEDAEDQSYYTRQARKHPLSDSSSSWTRTSTLNPNSNGNRLSSRPRRPPIPNRPSMRPDSREDHRQSPRSRDQSPRFRDSRTTSPLPTLSGKRLRSGPRLASPSSRRRNLSPSPGPRFGPTPGYETRTPPREGDHEQSKTSCERSSQHLKAPMSELRRGDFVGEGKLVSSSCPLTGSSSESHRKSFTTSSHTDTALSQDSSDGVDCLETRITDETQDTWCGDDQAIEPLLCKGDMDLPIRRMDTESPLTVNPTDAHFSPLTLTLDTPSPQSSSEYDQETNDIFEPEPHSTPPTRGRRLRYEISGSIDQIETGLAGLVLGSRDRDQDTSITRCSFETAARYRPEHEDENLADPQHETEDPMSALMLLVDTTINSWSEANGNDEEPARGGPGHEKGNDDLDGRNPNSEVKSPGPQVKSSTMAAMAQKPDLAKPAIQPSKRPEPKKGRTVVVKIEQDLPVLQQELKGDDRQMSSRLEAQMPTASSETASIPLLPVLHDDLGLAPQVTRHRPLESGSRHREPGYCHVHAPIREHIGLPIGDDQPKTGVIRQLRSTLASGQVDHPTRPRAVPSTGGRFVTAPIPTFDQLRARQLRTNPLSHGSARPMSKRDRIALFQAWYRARPVPICFPTPLSRSNLPDFDTRSGLWNRHPAPGVTTGHHEDRNQSGAASDLAIQPRPILPSPRQFPGIYLPAPIRDDGFVAGRRRQDLPEIPSVLRHILVPVSHDTPPNGPAEPTKSRPLEYVMRDARRNSPWNVVDLGLVAAKYKFILYPDMNPQPKFDDPIQIDRALTQSRCYTDEDSEILYSHFLMTIHDLLPLATRSACSAGTMKVPAVQTLRKIAENAGEFWPMDSVLPSRVDLFMGWIESVLIQGNCGWVLAEIDGEAFNPDTRSDRRE